MPWMPIGANANADAHTDLGQDYGKLKNNWVRWTGTAAAPAYRLGEAGDVVYVKGTLQGGSFDVVIVTLPPYCSPSEVRGPFTVLARTTSNWALAAVEIVPRVDSSGAAAADLIARAASGTPNTRFSIDIDFPL